MLQGVVQRGTAYQVSSLGRPLAGKTGTTNAYRSAWFVGFSPDLVVGVFVGFDDNRSLGEGETGAVDAVPVFIDFMQSALKTLPNRDFKLPIEAKFASVNGIREAFRPGTEPGPGPVSGGGDLAEPRGAATEEPPAVLPGEPTPGAKPKPPEDLSGLY
jgi:penicillin-binding protein 1A